MFIADTKWGKVYYQAELLEIFEGNRPTGKYQWAFQFSHLWKPGEQVRHATNRPWHRVGPIFEKSEKGSSYLGLRDGQFDLHAKVDVKKHIDEMVEEYNKAYPSEPTFQTPMIQPTKEDNRRGFIEHSRLSDLYK